MMNKFISFVILLTVGNLSGISGKLPSNIPLCSRNHPKLSDCIINSINTMQPYLANGNIGPGLQVPGLEPFHIREFEFGEDKGLKIWLSNVVVHGTSKFKVEKLRVNLKDLRFDVIVSAPKLDINGKYKLNFLLLNNPVKSDGDYISSFENAKLRITLQGHRYVKNGAEYMKFEPIILKMDLGKVKAMKLTNLFGGNKVLGEIVNSILLNDKHFLTNFIYPPFELQMSKQFTELANQIVAQSSLDELFPY